MPGQAHGDASGAHAHIRRSIERWAERTKQGKAGGAPCAGALEPVLFARAASCRNGRLPAQRAAGTAGCCCSSRSSTISELPAMREGPAKSWAACVHSNEEQRCRGASTGHDGRSWFADASDTARRWDATASDAACVANMIRLRWWQKRGRNSNSSGCVGIQFHTNGHCC